MVSGQRMDCDSDIIGYGIINSIDLIFIFQIFPVEDRYRHIWSWYIRIKQPVHIAGAQLSYFLYHAVTFVIFNFSDKVSQLNLLGRYSCILYYCNMASVDWRTVLCYYETLTLILPASHSEVAAEIKVQWKIPCSMSIPMVSGLRNTLLPSLKVRYPFFSKWKQIGHKNSILEICVLCHNKGWIADSS